MMSFRSKKQARWLAGQGTAALNEYHRTGRPDLLDAAVTAFERAVAAAPRGYPDLAGSLSGLALALDARYRLAADAADLDAAVEAGRQAVELTPPGHPIQGARLSNLGLDLRERFGQTGDAADLDGAVEAGQRAVDLTPPGHPNLAARLSKLAAALVTRFQLAAGATDLDAAVEAAQRAVAATAPATGTLRRTSVEPGVRPCLSGSERAGEPDGPGRRCRGRAKISRPHSARRPEPRRIPVELGLVLLARFERDGNAGDLDAAIEAEQRAAELASPRIRHRAVCLSNLGLLAASFARFRKPGTPQTWTPRSRPGSERWSSPRPAIGPRRVPVEPGALAACRGSSRRGTPRTWTPRSRPGSRRSS